MYLHSLVFMARFTILLFTLLLAASTAHAQDFYEYEPEPERDLWVATGLGIGGATDVQGAAVQASANYQTGTNLFKTRFSLVSELDSDTFYDLGLMYGRVLTQGSIYSSVSVGVASVGLPSSGLVDSDWDVGVPVEANVFFPVFEQADLGVTAFANLNDSESFGGLTLSLQFGA